MKFYVFPLRLDRTGKLGGEGIITRETCTLGSGAESPFMSAKIWLLEQDTLEQGTSLQGCYFGRCFFVFLVSSSVRSFYSLCAVFSFFFFKAHIASFSCSYLPSGDE
jgi:hypothetical protein